jgi:hypothetical protein
MAQYGSVFPDLVNAIFSRTGLREGELFVDIGSGIGQIVLQAPLFKQGVLGVGLELLKARHEVALNLELRARQVRQYVTLYRALQDGSTDAIMACDPIVNGVDTAAHPPRTLMLCGSFVSERRDERWEHPRIPLNYSEVYPSYASDRKELAVRLVGGEQANHPQAAITPPQLFHQGDVFFLNNAEDTMTSRNSVNLMAHIARLMRRMKVGARILMVDQCTDLETNSWNAFDHARDAEGRQRTCWAHEEEVELEGAYSWNRGEAKTQRLWLYTKVLDCWYCNSCTMEHKMYETVCETCAGDPGCTGAERRVSKRRRTKR